MSQNPLGPVNQDTGSLLTMTTAAATANGADASNAQGAGAQFGINVTAVTGTVTIHIQGKDFASGQYYDLLVSAGLNSPGFTQLTVYPGAPATSNVSTPQPLPKTFRVRAVLSAGTTGVSLTAGASLIV